MHTYIHACMHIYMNKYIHTYIHAYIHAYIHTYICPCRLYCSRHRGDEHMPTRRACASSGKYTVCGWLFMSVYVRVFFVWVCMYVYAYVYVCVCVYMYIHIKYIFLNLSYIYIYIINVSLNVSALILNCIHMYIYTYIHTYTHTGCTKAPSFGIKGTRQALFCGEHRPRDFVNVRHPRVSTHNVNVWTCAVCMCMWSVHT